MEPTPADTFDGYLITLGDGALEVHKCATLWTALPAVLFRRPVPPKVRIVTGVSRGRRDVEVQSVDDVEVQQPEPMASHSSERNPSRGWSARLVSVAGHTIGPVFRFRDGRSAEGFASEMRRQLAVMKR